MGNRYDVEVWQEIGDRYRWVTTYQGDDLALALQALLGSPEGAARLTRHGHSE